MIGCLVLLLNILLTASVGIETMSSDLKDRLWLYFYIREDGRDTERIYTDVIALRDELRNNGMKADFISKDQAMQFLEKRLPDVLNNLRKYGISNPLPATLYVTVTNEAQYEVLKDRISSYSSIITNTDQIQSTQTLKTQEKRVIRTITAANAIVLWSYILIWMLLITIVTILLYIITNDVRKHHRMLEIKKLLGSSYRSITMPFIWYGVVMSVWWWIIGVILFIILLVVSKPVLLELLQIDIVTIITQYAHMLLMTLWLQLLILIVLVYSLWYTMVYRQVKRL